jgi:hypothetical protein
MPVIDLTQYIAVSRGPWTDPSKHENLFEFTRAHTMSPDRLVLRWAGDFVALVGPLRVRVTVQAENVTLPQAFVSNLAPDDSAVIQKVEPKSADTLTATASKATIQGSTMLSEAGMAKIAKGGALRLQASTIYSYTLEIPAGHAWPLSLSEQLDTIRFQGSRSSRLEQLGNNLGFRVLIEPLFAVQKLVPVIANSDLPCDFAVADQPDTSRFFPSACEPCNGSVIGLPPTCTVSLVTPPAEGGCVRTRFFNGMFITREDLETEQRYHRLKSKLHNRASGAAVVVWGFNVCLQQGGRVSVLPGYGVDCCGNDLALTTQYDVEIAALMADPAAAPLLCKGGSQRLFLLLEYVECPRDPRPVHGDPCSPELSRCEMSRIRESVRLRLVPPCDDNRVLKQPISRFLEAVKTLQERFPLDLVPDPQGATLAPFTLQITAAGNRGNPVTVTVRPSSSFDNNLLKPINGFQPLATIEVQVIFDSPWTFIGGGMSGAVQAGSAQHPDLVDPPSPVDLSLLASGFSRPSLKMTLKPMAGRETDISFVLAGWRAQTLFAAQDDPTASGDLTLSLHVNADAGVSAATLNSSVSMTALDLDRSPCDDEPCAPDRKSERGGGRFIPGRASIPLSPSTDPTHPSHVGDTKALALAAIGGWLSQMLVRERAGTSSEILTTRREAAQAIYRLAWLLLFGMPEKANTAELGGALHRLLEDLCDELLYPGPKCCGDPHGVVIGCALVEGGTISRVDPFGGRHYLVNYSLLEYWCSVFGIPSLDLSLSQLFSRICCLVGLPAIHVDSPGIPVLVVPIGRGLLAVGEPAEIAKRLGDRARGIDRRKVGLAEFIASAIALLSTSPSKDQATRLNGLVLDDFVAEQTVMLLVPAPP